MTDICVLSKQKQVPNLAKEQKTSGLEFRKIQIPGVSPSPNKMRRNRGRMSDATSTINGSSALSHLILAGSAGWSLLSLAPPAERPFGSFAFLFLVHHGLFGFVRYAYPNPPEWLDDVLRHTSRLAEHVLLPLINLELSMAANISQELNALHAVSAIATTVIQFAFKDYHRHSVDASMLLNIGSTLYIGLWHDNPWAVGLSALSAMNHFVFSRISSKVEVPKYDLIAIGTSFFALFAVKSISEFVLKYPWVRSIGTDPIVQGT